MNSIEHEAYSLANELGMAITKTQSKYDTMSYQLVKMTGRNILRTYYISSFEGVFSFLKGYSSCKIDMS